MDGFAFKRLFFIYLRYIKNSEHCRAYSNICYMVLELIRQFYDETRSFRITGSGKEEFISYDNSNIRLSESMGADGQMYSREPVFDIKISAEKQNSYQRNAQNELAVSLLNLGVFDPARVDMTLPMLELMTFEGKEKLVDTLSKNATLQDKMMGLMQLCINAANTVGGEFGMALMQQVQALVGDVGSVGVAQPISKSGKVDVDLSEGKKNRYIEKARERTAKTTEV